MSGVNGLTYSDQGGLDQSNRRTTNLIFTNSLGFNKKFFNEHAVTAFLGQEVQMNNEMNTRLTMADLQNNPTREDVAGEGFQVTGKTNSLSYFSQLKYGFRDKYFLQGSFRVDGSSNFGPSNRYGTFWSLGAAYIVSEESFLKNKLSWLDLLKFRGSLGPAGNSAAIEDSYRLTHMKPDEFLGNPAIILSSGGNAGIRWEKTLNWDLGMELSLLNNRVSIVADVYRKMTKDFIAYVPMPLGTGFDSYQANIGDIKNTGLELAVTARLLNIRNFGWTISANWSRNKNTLTKSYYPETRMGTTINRVGEEYNSFKRATWEGVNKETGRPQWIDEDKNNTSELTNILEQIVGKVQPDGFGGLTNTFSYKNFSVTATLFFTYGSTIWGTSEFQNDGMFPYINQSVAALDHWRKPGDNSPNPRRLFKGAINGIQEDFGTIGSTRYAIDGSYIRFSNLNLDYNFPALLCKKMAC